MALATLIVLDALLLAGLLSYSLATTETWLVNEPVLLTNVTISKLFDSPTFKESIVHFPSI